MVIKSVSFALAMALAAAVQGAVVYSWENTAQGLTADNGSALTTYSSIGATNGSYSVRIGHDVPIGWVQLAKTFDGGLYSQLKNGGTVSIDVTVVQTAPGTINWNQLNLAYNGPAPISWTQLAAKDIGTPVLNTPVTKTVTFTLPDVPDTLGYYGLHMIWNSGMNAGGTAGAKADIYVDNMVVTAAPVPEPTLVALAGLALPLLGRRRAAK